MIFQRTRIEHHRTIEYRNPITCTSDLLRVIPPCVLDEFNEFNEFTANRIKSNIALTCLIYADFAVGINQL